MTSGTQTVLITGATDGLGRTLAHRLAADGAALILHGRDPGKLERTADDIRDDHRVARPRTVLADLADLSQVRRMAADIQQDTDHLDVLVSNAGIGSGEPDGRTRRTSADGYELRFAVNYLAGFLLTRDLLPLLRRSAPARIVNVASIGQHPLDFADLMLERRYTGTRAYGQSKLAQIMSGFELASRVPAAEVTVNSLHPATFMPTKIVLTEIGYHVDSLEEGVAATTRLAADSALAGVSGQFFDRTRPATAHRRPTTPAREPNSGTAACNSLATHKGQTATAGILARPAPKWSIWTPPTPSEASDSLAPSRRYTGDVCQGVCPSARWMSPSNTGPGGGSDAQNRSSAPSSRSHSSISRCGSLLT
jgi:NAD(P)-dependent dehydrogenase (short-subunit alcohol dehydrogenase family)